MGFILCASGAEIITNASSALNGEWEVAIDPLVVVPYGNWMLVGQLQLQLQIFISVAARAESNYRGNTERFLNPTQSQVGYVSMLSDGFVVDSSRIQYDKQAHSYLSPIINIANTEQDAGLVLRRTTNSRESHAQTISPVPICGSGQLFITAPGGISPFETSSEIPDGGICMRVAPGADEFVTMERITTPPGFIQLLVDRKQYSGITAISGLVYSGYDIEVGWTIGYHDAGSNAERADTGGLLTGGGAFTPVTYTCVAGNSIPVTPQPCSQSEIRVVYIPDGSGGFVSSVECGGG